MTEGKGGGGDEPLLPSAFERMVTEEVQNAYADVLKMQQRYLYPPPPPLTRWQKIKRLPHRAWAYRPVIMTHKKLEDERMTWY